MLGTINTQIHLGHSQSVRPWLLSWLVLAACFAPFRLIPVTSGLNLADFLVVGAAVLAITVALLRRERLPVPLFMAMAALLWLLSGALTTAVLDDSGNMLVATEIVLAAVFYPLIITWGVQGDPLALRRVLQASALGATTLAIIAVSNRLGIPIFGIVDEAAAKGGRATGGTYHANVLAMLTAINLPVAFYLGVSSRSRIGRWLAVAACILLLWALYLTKSRTGALALLVGAVPWIGLSWSDSGSPFSKILSFFLLAFLGLLMIFWAISPQIFNIDAESGLGRLLSIDHSAGVSDQGRAQLLKFSWNGFLSSPFLGEGYGWLRYAHNHFVSILHCGGLLGALAFTLHLFGIVLATLMVPRGAALKSLRACLSSSLLIWFTVGMFQPALTERVGYVPLGVLFVLVFWPQAGVLQMRKN